MHHRFIGRENEAYGRASEASAEPFNNINIYKLSEDERKAKDIKALPSSLLEALAELDQDEVLKNALGTEIYSAFRRAKLEECEDYRIHVTDWEFEKYLESA